MNSTERRMEGRREARGKPRWCERLTTLRSGGANEIINSVSPVLHSNALSVELWSNVEYA